ncbi:restriction endonuclease subunit S [Leptospira levettii]|uniref:restriction endonuclease subunit S n=1 Tax=Leptospira levettii TaxID=2023178 RepID=UPI0010831C6D|nr:restriction endonuclease subunit S [Leptospira levettii]TGM66441.1 restriction endonuclease subunit S [Leptospira levettii]
MGENKKKPEIRFQGFHDEWQEKEYKNIFINIPNNTLSRSELNYNFGLVKNIHYGDVLIKFGELLDVKKEELPFITNNILANKYLSSSLKNGDIIIADAAEDETVGKCTEVANIDKELVVSGLHTIPIRPIESFSVGYLGYFMNSSAYHSQLLRLMQGTKVLSISKSALKDTLFRYPLNKTEQSQIGKFFQDIDQLISLRQKKLDKLKNLKKAFLNKMFPKEGSDVPEIRFEGFSGKWVTEKLETLTEVNQGLQIAISKRYREYVIGSYFYITNEFLKENPDIKYYILNPPESVICKESDVLMTRTGNTGHVVTNVSGAFHNNFFRIKFSHDQLNKIFFVCFLKLPQTQELILKLAGTSTIPDLNHKDFYGIKLAYPTNIDEQTKIGNLFQTLDRLISLQDKEVEKLKNLKKAFLSKMFV